MTTSNLQPTAHEPGAGALQFVPPSSGGQPGIQIAPMVDIVFLLICFFMLATELVSSQQDERVSLPEMSNPESRSQAPAEIIVNLLADGSVSLGGRTLSRSGLEPLLTAENTRAMERSQPLRVVIRADRRQHYAALDDVLSACRRAGLTQVIFRAREGEGS
jgi:biopolymer transport protein ExbD